MPEALLCESGLPDPFVPVRSVLWRKLLGSANSIGRRLAPPALATIDPPRLRCPWQRTNAYAMTPCKMPHSDASSNTTVGSIVMPMPGPRVAGSLA